MNKLSFISAVNSGKDPRRRLYNSNMNDETFVYDEKQTLGKKSFIFKINRARF